MDYSFRVADFPFRLTCPDCISPPENFMKFSAAPSASDYSYTLSLTDVLPEPSGRLVAKRDDILVFRDGERESRYLRYHGALEEETFACCRETGETSTHIDLRPSVLDDLVYDTMFTSLFALERRVFAQDALILHSAYIRHEGQAILFSAPSGTGKSTQAGLWERYRGVKQVNGDRSLLRKIGGVWHACGWPVCGSSEICNNVDTPIRAIVMLSQAEENSIRRLPVMQAFSQLYPQITINRWDRDFQTHAMDLIETLIREIPVYHLACTISEAAVDCLDKALMNNLS